jgi:hypothetical protein
MVTLPLAMVRIPIQDHFPANKISTLSFQLMTTPLLQTPPKSLVPDPERDPDWFGEIWLKYPSGSALVPLQCGVTFKAKMDFSVILNESMFEIDKDSNQDFLARNGATRIIAVTKKLDHWYRNLPESLSPTKIVFPSQLKLQYVTPNYILILIQQYSSLCSCSPSNMH